MGGKYKSCTPEFDSGRGGAVPSPLARMIDIRDNPNNCIDIINEVLNDGGIVEIKNEKRKGKDNIVVVRQLRVVLTQKPKD